MTSLRKMLYIGVRRSYFCLCFHNEETEVQRVASCPRPQVLLVHIIDSMTPSLPSATSLQHRKTSTQLEQDKWGRVAAAFNFT